MALRIRKDGRVLCAAHNPPEPGDLYLDDFVHGYLGWCHEDHPDTRQLDNYNWETHEYYVDGSGREEKVKQETEWQKFLQEVGPGIREVFGLEPNQPLV